MKYIECDNCGDRDDWRMKDIPFFPDGLVLQFRNEDGGEDFCVNLELCVECKDAVLTALPKLAEALKARE